MRLYIIRHGAPDYPRDALSEEGHREARAVAMHLGRRDVDRVVSSPMRRARETARYTADALGLEVEVEEWLAELESWVLSDPSGGEMPAWEIAPATVRGWRGLTLENWHTFPPLAGRGLRSRYEELARRSDEFLARHGCVRQGDGYRLQGRRPRIALFCHCGSALTWLAHLVRVPPPRIWAGFTLAPGSVTTVELEVAADGQVAPRCPGLGEIGHLR